MNKRYTFFLDQIIEDHFMFEISPITKDINKIECIDPSIVPIKMKNESEIPRFIEHYYYNVEIIDISNYSTSQQIEIDLNENLEFAEILSNDGYILRNEFRIGLKIMIDLDFTSKMVSLCTGHFQGIQKVDRLFSKLINVPDVDNNNNFIEKLRNNKLKLHSLIAEADENIKNAEFVLKMSNTDVRFTKEDMEDKISIISNLKVINGKVMEGNFNVHKEFEGIINVKRIGIVHLSFILHSLWNDVFPIYSKQFYRHLIYLGFFEKTAEGDQALIYTTYQKKVNKIIDTCYQSVNKTPNYSHISYYISNQFSIYDVMD